MSNEEEIAIAAENFELIRKMLILCPTLTIAHSTGGSDLYVVRVGDIETSKADLGEAIAITYIEMCARVRDKIIKFQEEITNLQSKLDD